VTAQAAALLQNQPSLGLLPHLRNRLLGCTITGLLPWSVAVVVTWLVRQLCW
jgi:hypothetical protein